MSETPNPRIGLNIGDAILGALDKKGEALPPAEPQEELETNHEEEVIEESQPPKKDGFLSDLTIEEPPATDEEELEPEHVGEEEQPKATQQPKPEPEHEEEDDVQPNDPPRFKKRMERIKKKLEEQQEQLKREYEARLAEMEAKAKAQPEQPAGPAPTDEERKELLMLRRKYQLDSDPDIKQRYDEPLKANHDKVKSILAKNGMPEESIAYIEKMGGFDRFAEQMPEKAKEVLDAVQKASAIDASILQSKIAESITLRESKQRELEKAAAEADKYFKENQDKTQNEVAKLTETYVKQGEQNMHRLREHAKQTMERSTLLADVAIADDMAEGEREKAQRINQRRALIRSKVEQAINVKTPEDAAEVAVAAAMSFELKEQLKEANAALAKARAELARLRKAGQTAPKGNLNTQGQAETPAPRKAKSWREGFDQSLEQLGQ